MSSLDGYDSGRGSSKRSSLKSYYEEFIPHLQQVLVGAGDQELCLGDVDLIQTTTVTRPKSKATIKSNEKRTLCLDELTHLVDLLKTDNAYSEKVASIMLRNLEKTLGTYFQVFLSSGLPDNFFPIVKFNSDNTPYVELLIKSEASDQDPFSQLGDYTEVHSSYCRFVICYLRKYSSKFEPVAHSGDETRRNHLQIKDRQLNQMTPRSTTSKSKATKNIYHSKQRTSLPPEPMCSTPLANKILPQRKPASEPKGRELVDEILNCSKRVLPARACKSTSRYQV